MGLSWGKSNGELYKVENEETLRRDSRNSAVLETDMNSLELYRRRREQAKKKDNDLSKPDFPKKITPTKTPIKQTDPIQNTQLNLAKLAPENDADGTIVEQDNASFSQGLMAYKKGDFKTSFSHWYPLAQKGNAESQNRLGYLYENGEGVKKDYKKAVEWYLKAAEKDEPAAQFNLGVMYRKGRGVQKNDRIARRWYEKAAKQGHPIAERVVEVMKAYKIGE